MLEDKYGYESDEIVNIVGESPNGKFWVTCEGVCILKKHKDDSFLDFEEEGIDPEEKKRRIIEDAVRNIVRRNASQENIDRELASLKGYTHYGNSDIAHSM